jgi:hypothetical protein
MDQLRITARIRADFNPLGSIQTATNEANNESKGEQSIGRRTFDTIWTFEIVGRKFEQVVNPLQIGVFES